MRTLIAIALTCHAAALLAANAEPALPATPFRLPPLFESATPKGLDYFGNEFAMQSPFQTVAQARTFGVTARRGCYFIRQVNRNLKPAFDKPRLIPLAAEVSSGVYAADPDCLPSTIIRKASRE